MRKFLISIIIVLFYAGLSFGQTPVAAGDGTLSAAIANATSGAVLELENGGVYTESTDSVLIIDKVLTIQTQNSEGERATVRMEADTNLVTSTDFFLMQEGSSLTLSGIEFYGMSDAENAFRTTGNLIVIDTSAVTGSLTILNCYFHHATGWMVDDNESGSMADISIDNSIVTDCKGGPHFKNGALTGSVTVTNSTFMNITDRFIRAQPADPWAQPGDGDAEGYVDHVTVYNVDGKRIIMAKDNTKGWVVTNSIFSTFTGSETGSTIRPGATDSLNYLQNCILHDNIGLHGDWGTVEDTSTADPMFTDAENGDLTLMEGSPALTMASDGGAIGDPRWAGSVTALKSEPSTLLDGYALHQNYPNPFNPTTTIKFDLAEAGFTSLKIFNMIGQQLAELVGKRLNAGSYSFDFDASTLTSGIYFYTIQSNGFSKTNKMVLIK